MLQKLFQDPFEATILRLARPQRPRAKFKRSAAENGDGLLSHAQRIADAARGSLTDGPVRVTSEELEQPLSTIEERQSMELDPHSMDGAEYGTSLRQKPQRLSPLAEAYPPAAATPSSPGASPFSPATPTFSSAQHEADESDGYEEDDGDTDSVDGNISVSSYVSQSDLPASVSQPQGSLYTAPSAELLRTSSAGSVRLSRQNSNNSIASDQSALSPPQLPASSPAAPQFKTSSPGAFGFSSVYTPAAKAVKRTPTSPHTANGSAAELTSPAAVAPASAAALAPLTPEMGTGESSAAGATEAFTSSAGGAHAAADRAMGDAAVPDYIPRDHRTPYMERKLRDLQEQDWKGAGDIGEDSRPIKSRAEHEREEILASWRQQDLEAAAAAADAQTAADSRQGELGQGFKVRKSRLEQEKEAAARQARGPSSHDDLPSYMRPTANSAHRSMSSPAKPQTPLSPAAARKLAEHASPAGQGLEDVLRPHRSALDQLKGSGGSRYEPIRKAPAPAVPGLDEVLVVTKSQLELEKEAAAGGQPRPVTTTKGEDARNRAHAAREAAAAAHASRFQKAGPKPKAPDTFEGKGLAEVCIRHKSVLERNKEASEAAGANSPTARVHTPPRSHLHTLRQSEAWGNKGLGDIQKPHRSRLEIEKEAWCNAMGVEYKPARKLMAHTERKVNSPGQDPHAPSFMRDTCSSSMKHIDMPEPPRTPAS